MDADRKPDSVDYFWPDQHGDFGGFHRHHPDLNPNGKPHRNYDTNSAGLTIVHERIGRYCHRHLTITVYSYRYPASV